MKWALLIGPEMGLTLVICTFTTAFCALFGVNNTTTINGHIHIITYWEAYWSIFPYIIGIAILGWVGVFMARLINIREELLEEMDQKEFRKKLDAERVAQQLERELAELEKELDGVPLLSKEHADRLFTQARLENLKKEI